jgi:hypothetical protein
MRARRLAQGWSCYELWLPPADAARLAELKQPGESLTGVVGRALRALQAPAATGLSPKARKVALLARVRALRAAGQSLDAIAQQLNAEGVPTLSGNGVWRAGVISNLLRPNRRAQG